MVSPPALQTAATFTDGARWRWRGHVAGYVDARKKGTAFRRFQAGSSVFQWGLSLSGATPTSLAKIKVHACE
ncbi:hypothetical protein LBMAG56_42900 [Verrucomicrobiota bacterium]|nr:hypothetical protein LBMAG56_42900 [Verrucomicrobiota bacterium]